MTPFMTIRRYFSAYENLYFLILASVQLSTLGLIPTEWSPTGPYSTAIPLLLCLLVEIVGDCVQWISNWQHDRNENNQQFTCIDGSIKRSGDLVVNDVIRLEKNQTSPINGIVIDCGDKLCKVNRSLLNGESKIHYTNFILAGYIIRSQYAFVSMTSARKFNSQDTKQKTSRIDSFVSEYMINISLYMLLFLIIFVSVIKTFVTKGSIILFIVQNWILFNGLVPFSIKIYLILVRNLQCKLLDKIRVTEPKIIDDVAKIDMIVTDKTGTLTKNVLEVVRVIEFGSRDVVCSWRFPSGNFAPRSELCSHEQVRIGKPLCLMAFEI